MLHYISKIKHDSSKGLIWISSNAISRRCFLDWGVWALHEWKDKWMQGHIWAMSVLLQALARTGRLGVVSCITTIYGSIFPHFMFAMTVSLFNLIFPHISCETVERSSRIVTMWIKWWGHLFTFWVRIAAVKSVGARNNLWNRRGIFYWLCSRKNYVKFLFSNWWLSEELALLKSSPVAVEDDKKNVITEKVPLIRQSHVLSFRIISKLRHRHCMLI